MHRHTQFLLMSKGFTLVILFGAYCSEASAQSDVSAYGRIVVGVHYLTNDAKPSGGFENRLRGAGNQWGTSLLGFKGKEELGDGLSAHFRLETGFATMPNTPNGPLLWNRHAYVGLDGKFGTLRMGKTLSISNDVWFLDPTSQQFMGSSTLVRGRSWNLAEGMVEYHTPPVWGGFNVGLQSSVSRSAPEVRKDGVSLAYLAPTYELRAIYDVARDPAGRYNDLFNNSKEAIVGGTVTIDKLKLYAAFVQLSAPDVPAGTPDKLQHYWTGARYKATPALTLIASVFHVKQNNGGGSANLFMVGNDYNLSARTLLYASIGTVRNSRNANFSADVYENPLPGQNQMSAYFGLSHSF